MIMLWDGALEELHPCSASYGGGQAAHFQAFGHVLISDKDDSAHFCIFLITFMEERVLGVLSSAVFH